MTETGSAVLDDAAFKAAFESRALTPEQFRNADHVRLAYLYLREAPFDEALHRLAHGLRALTVALGAEGKFHATITTAYAALIAERLQRCGDPGSWPAFAAAHPDLLDASVVKRLYPGEILNSERARRTFVLPAPA